MAGTKAGQGEELPLSEHLIGADLSAWRRRLGLTQRAAAERLGVEQGTVSKGESKGTAVLGPALRTALADALADEDPPLATSDRQRNTSSEYAGNVSQEYAGPMADRPLDRTERRDDDGESGEVRIVLRGLAAGSHAPADAALRAHREASRWAADPSLPEPVRALLREQATHAAAALVAIWARAGGEIGVDEMQAALVQPVAAPPPVAAPEPPRPAAIAPVPSSVPSHVSTPPPGTDALARLKLHLETGGVSDTIAPVVDWEPLLVGVLASLGPGRDDEAELEHVHAAVSQCQTWVTFPADVQRGLIAHCAARLRLLQEHGVRDRRMDHVFLTLTAYSARERPGFVIGLNRSHKPMRGTWQEDADAWWDRLASHVSTDEAPSPNHEKILANLEKLVREIAIAPAAARGAVQSQTIRELRLALEAGISARDPRLVRLATPLADQLASPELRNLRRAIRDEQEAAGDTEESEAAPEVHLPPEWGWWGRTKGRRALMVGGSPREPNRVRLERIFGFSSLEWVPAEHRRNGLVSVRNRVRAGGVDVVLILRSFVGHDADEIILPACRETGVDWVHVDQGYGVVRVRQAIERFLDPTTAAPVGG